MKNANKSNNAFKRIIYSLIGITILILLIIVIQPQLIFAQKDDAINAAANSLDTSNYKVTFIELGSVKCIPCKEMQPVMKSIEKKYGSQVKVIFHDLWTSAGKEAAKQFVFDVIPTQIFLDKTGKEYYRHEGFFPKNELVKILKIKGVR
jgi:thioredoxin 1